MGGVPSATEKTPIHRLRGRIPALRAFLAAAGLTGLLCLGGGTAAAQDTAQSGAQLLLQTSPLAGFRYYEGRVLWRRLREGDVLQLVREPGNSWDAFAIRVEWRGHMLGYVPRRDNVPLARLLDRGAPLAARIVQLRKSRNPWQRVIFDVYEPLGR